MVCDIFVDSFLLYFPPIFGFSFVFRAILPHIFMIITFLSFYVLLFSLLPLFISFSPLSSLFILPPSPSFLSLFRCYSRTTSQTVTHYNGTSIPSGTPQYFRRTQSLTCRSLTAGQMGN